MINVKSAMLVLALGLGAGPAVAKDSVTHAGFEARAEVIGSELAVNAAQRADALRECNKEVAPFREYTWGVQNEFRYRACMNEHGQAE